MKGAADCISRVHRLQVKTQYPSWPTTIGPTHGAEVDHDTQCNSLLWHCSSLPIAKLQVHVQSC